ncbi:MAG TPA: FtsX-like permease family protein [Kofleriaceae bacterium]|nr:FtsX-like permease family protein [Kofleriaceae bacterium]
MLLRIALRNLLRQRRRTLILMITIVFSFALLLMFTGLADGAHQAMADIGVRMGLGHVVVYPAGYREDPSLDHLIADRAPIDAAIAKLGGDVAHAAPRLRTDGLIEAGATSIGVTISGGDPAIEPLVSHISSKSALVDGGTLASCNTGNPGQLPPALIGQELAKSLGVHVGDRVALSVRPRQSKDMRLGAFAVCGVFRTGVREVDSFWVEIPLDEAQHLANAGQGVTMVALLLTNSDDAASVSDRLASALRDHPVEVLPWQKAAPELYSAISVDEGGMYVFMVIIFVVVAAGILNALLMSVLERTREFGVLLALGAAPSQVIAIVLYEAVALGIAAVGAGLAAGLGINHYLATHGLDYKELFGNSVQAGGILLPDKFYSVLAPDKVVWSTAVVLGLVIIGALYPAIHAARFQPTKAMHHV